MSDLQHPHLDLLKLDVEGAEFAVLESLARDNVACAAITVEFDQPTPIAGIVRSVARLRKRAIV